MGKCTPNIEANNIFHQLTNPDGNYQLLAPNIKLLQANNGSNELYGITLLGSPIGTDDFKVKYHTEKISTIKEQSQRLILLEDTQTKFLLLNQCFNTKINHLLRTVRTYLTIPHLIKPFNTMLLNIITSIMELQDITEKQWTQCKLRINQGGLGIRVSEPTAYSAYAASFLSSFPDIEQLLTNLREIISNPNNNTSIPSINNYVASIRIINYKQLLHLYLLTQQSQ